MAKSICASCNKVFKSVPAFDMHRTGSYGEAIYKQEDTQKKKAIGHTPHTRRCMTTEEMLAIGMVQNEKGLWITEPYKNEAHAHDEEREEASDTLEVAD